MKKSILLGLILFTLSLNAQCWKSVSLGADFCIALKQDGTLWGWGNNGSGQLGIGSFDNKSLPERIGLDSDWDTVSAGYGFVVALKTNGTIWVWGRNDYGLGSALGNTVNIPSQVGTDTDWKFVIAGGAHSMAIKNNGTLWGWGRNDFGQLGNGSFSHTNIPTQAGDDNDWETVAAGTFFNLSVKTDKTLWSWGYNFHGQLGHGTAGFGTEVNTPTQITALPANQWKCIAVGGRHSMAITETGSLWVWGNNNNRALGINDGSFYKSLPTRIDNATNWKFAAGGLDHTLAIKDDHTLWAWGENTDGQLGDNSVVNRPTPVQVGAVADWKMADGGLQHSAFLKGDDIFTSGGNSYGELGIGSLTSYPALQPVTCPVPLGIDAYTQSSFVVYPNPVPETLNIKASAEVKDVLVYDMSGRLVKTSNTKNAVDVSDLESQVYIVKIITAHGIYNTKIKKK